MIVNILGVPYEVIVKRFEDDPAFKKRDICGYCDDLLKQIVVCDPASYEGCTSESAEYLELSKKETLRHEIVHAFFSESGLERSSFVVDSAWAKNEEMVDWFAIQGPKIFKAWREADAL